MAKENASFPTTPSDVPLEDDPRLKRRFTKGVDHEDKLKEVLEVAGLSHLYESSLLNPVIQAEHASHIEKLVHLKVDSIRRTEFIPRPELHERMNKEFKFLTIIDRVIPVYTEVFTDDIERFKKKLYEQFDKHPSLWVLGSIEIEMIHMPTFRANKPKANTEAGRKLKNIEASIKELGPFDSHHDSYFLIHFHGLVYHPRAGQLDKIKKSLEKDGEWNKHTRQVDLKALYVTSDGKPTTFEENIKRISYYLVKGGQSCKNGRPYLLYKVKYEKGDTTYEDKDVEDDIIAANLESKIRYENDEYPLSLTKYEILCLTLYLSEMMKLKNEKKEIKGKGYLVMKTKRRRKKGVKNKV